MKKLLILITILGILFVSPVHAVTNEVDLDDKVVFTVDLYSFQIEPQNTRLTLSRTQQLDLMSVQNKQNYKKARQLIEEIPFEDYALVGAKEYFLNELTRYEEEGLYLEDQYSITISPMGQVSWGSYEGVPMRAVTSNTFTSYILEKKGSSINNWVRGIVDFAMNWNPFKSLDIAYSLIGNIQPQYTASTNDVVQFISREDRETRVVYCQDIYEIYGPSSQYIGQIGDEHVAADVYVSTIPASPYLPVVTNKTVGLTHIYTTNYTNISVIKEEAYNNYMMGRSLITRYIPRATLITK